MAWGWPFARKDVAVPAPVNAQPVPAQIAAIYGLFLNPSEITPRQAWMLYENVAPLAKVVDLIADQVAGLDPLFLADDKPVNETAAKYLRQFFAKPGFNRDRRRLIKELAVQMLVTGTGYLAAYGNVDRDPAALDVLKSMYVTNMQGPAMWPGSYIYAEGTLSKQFTMIPDRTDFRWIDPMGLAEIIPIYDMDGQRRGVGLSRLSAIRMDVELRLAGTEHNMGLLGNGARPSGALTFKSSLTPDTKADIAAQLRDSMSGPRNAGRIFVFGGGEADFVQMSQSAKDMDWANLVKMVEDAIVARYSVPPTLFNMAAQTDNNYETAWTQFYDNAVLPTYQILWGAMGSLLSRRLGVDLTIKHDTLTNNTLARQAAARAQQLRGSNIITVNEARLMVGFEPLIGGDDMVDPLSGPMEDFFTDRGPSEQAAGSITRESAGAEKRVLLQ